MKQKGPVSVLIAPLDWGLGHATRCIPIVKELIQQGALVKIAASGSLKTLLIQEFPLLEFLDIPGYNIGYKPGFLLKWGLVFRIPAILKQIKRENQWLEKTLQNHTIDAVISDNRYGLFQKNRCCVFITHQLYIQSGFFNKTGVWPLAALPAESRPDGRRRMDSWINKKILKWNYGFIGKFSSCWVPDQEGYLSVAGKLSHPPIKPPVPVKYIGILSRFNHSENNGTKNSLLILLSGPEPQRTRFENIILRQLAGSGWQTVVVRGLPGEGHSIPIVGAGIKIFNHLPSDQLNELLNESECIITRSGYSTIMDLLRVKKNAVLVPTPGQPEQEYLGRHLHEKKWMYTVSQKNFNLEKTVNAFHKTEMKLPEIPETTLQQVVEEFLREIVERRI
jgi:UDP:flavonoid glycosyltransferase YjiC (YdhE family)